LVPDLAKKLKMTFYNVGVGRADVTGPAAEIGMMGFADANQKTGGIHIRTFSRAFIIEEPTSGSRVVFVSCDTAMISQLVKMKVLENLDLTYPGVYTEKNVLLSATHTHSVPAGFMQYFTFNITNLGFIQQNFDVMVGGITRSIKKAHESLAPGRIFLVDAEVEEQASINRNPISYNANPEEERARYSSNVDTKMVQLNFHDVENNPIGILNWFAVHPTSMNKTNRLISGDNKGAASLMMEKLMCPSQLAGQSSFVAAFASSNLGDVSPNIKGPRCEDTGDLCDSDGKCDGRTELCVARGPGGTDIFESTRIIAERQFKVARDLLLNPPRRLELHGPVQCVHQWLDMSQAKVTLADGSTGHTSKPALGYSFAAGTTDGQGDLNFIQGMTKGDILWDSVKGLLGPPSAAQKAEHAPKPILLNTGEYYIPFQWHPVHVDSQVLRVGQLLIAAAPGEFTTMAGRRLRETVAEAWREECTVVLAGLANSYTHYITTWEEYQTQRYEAASTIYGPHTLLAYQQQYARIVKALLDGEDLDRGTPPPDLSSKQITFLPGVIMDNPPLGKSFGQCLKEPVGTVKRGERTSATFVSGHLRNDLMTETSFLTVERKESNSDGWLVVARDADWETKLLWTRTNVVTGESNVQVIWEVPMDAIPGTYRLGHRGFHKSLTRGIKPYEGWSRTFQVV